MTTKLTGTYVFDLETQRLAQEVGGWSHIDKLGFAAGVLIAAETKEVFRFTEGEVEALIDKINAAVQIIGFNLLRFDYVVLKPYGLEISESLQKRSLDLLQEIYQTLGFRVSLDSLAQATLDAAKSADGLQSVRWYKEGRIDKVLEYCENDVLVTLQLWEYGKKAGLVHYFDRDLRKKPIRVNW